MTGFTLAAYFWFGLGGILTTFLCAQFIGLESYTLFDTNACYSYYRYRKGDGSRWDRWYVTMGHLRHVAFLALANGAVLAITNNLLG